MLTIRVTAPSSFDPNNRTIVNSATVVCATTSTDQNPQNDIAAEKTEIKPSVNVKLADGGVKFIPPRTELLQNYPNPFNPETWIPFRLAESGEVEIRIYELTGRLIKRIDLGQTEAGSYIAKGKAAYWDGRDELGERVASGLYIYQMLAGGKMFTRKMVILR